MDGYKLVREDVRYAVYLKGKGNHVIIAFRGTADFNDIKDDAMILACDTPVQFLQQAIWVLFDVIEKHKPTQVSLTGHSLGGAVAYQLSRCLASVFKDHTQISQLLTPQLTSADPTAYLRGKTEADVSDVRARIDKLPEVDFVECHLFNPGAGNDMLVGAAATGATVAAHFNPIADVVFLTLDTVGTVKSILTGDAFRAFKGPPSDPITIHHVMGDPISMQWNPVSNYGTRINYCSDGYHGYHDMVQFCC